jgi:hypothetical protein
VGAAANPGITPPEVVSAPEIELLPHTLFSVDCGQLLVLETNALDPEDSLVPYSNMHAEPDIDISAAIVV